MNRGAVLLGPTAVPCTPQHHLSALATSLKPAVAHRIFWRTNFTVDITAQLVSWGNLEVQVTNSDLELAGSVIHYKCMVSFFDICEQNTLYRMDNVVGLWRQRKGPATSTSSQYHLLRLQYIHQRFHCYVPHHGFMRRVDNGISKRLDHSRYLTYASLLAHMENWHPQKLPWILWIPSRGIFSVIASALQQTTSPRESLIVDPPLTMGTVRSGPSSTKTCPSTPYLYRTGIRCLSSTPLQGNTGQEPFPSADVKYDPTQLRTPYGRLDRRLPLCGP